MTLPTSITTMKTMLEELTQNFPAHVASKPAPTSETILVTGTTGILGSYILNQLISTLSVTRIYALNRPDREGKMTVRQRQARAFEEHGIDPAVLDSRKLVLLEGDTSLPGLGVPREACEEIVNSATTIIHNGENLCRSL